MEIADPPASGAMLAPNNAETSFEVSLGRADQACKECRRRKSKCNKSIPICDLCLRYRRHCLYEKHSRSPLTRRHLTEVEERLERAEALIRRMKQSKSPSGQNASRSRRVATPTRSSSQQRPQGNGNDSGFSSLDIQRQDISSLQHSSGGLETRESLAATEMPAVNTGPGDQVHSSLSLDPLLRTPDHSVNMQPAAMLAGDNTHPATPKEKRQEDSLESPPSSGDFEWDEQEMAGHPSPQNDGTNSSDDGGARVLDGMASLTVGDGESGYLGVASGAALLRILEPPKSTHDHSGFTRGSNGDNNLMFPRITVQPNVNKHIADSMIDAYFRQYHVSYPIVHEPTFRAQYSEVIPRPNGNSWLVLAYIVAALGVFCSATDKANNLDVELFAQMRSILSFDFLQMGNLTLVQALSLISNYQQKRDKPNSSYNYLGLAVRMAVGLGLQKEFQGWNISPLKMEIRRRVWWCLCVFDVGGTITFSRPLLFPLDSSEVALPLNVNDRDLTAASKTYPPESNEATSYTHARIQASFHVITAPIYTRVISKPFPTVEELTRLERQHLTPWLENLPAYWKEDAAVVPRFGLAHAVMMWRCRNFRIIMYRPIVVRRALLRARQSGSNDEQQGDSLPEGEQRAYNCCLADAKFTIESITEYWEKQTEDGRNRLAAWYALYFLFQSALIPCICLRNEPLSPMTTDWRAQITTTLRTIAALEPVHPSAARSYQIIADLCGRYLNVGFLGPAAGFRTGENPALVTASGAGLEVGHSSYEAMGPVEESPQTQINSVFPMMWPNAAPMEAADLVMGDDAAWMEYLGAGNDHDGREWLGEADYSQ